MIGILGFIGSIGRMSASGSTMTSTIVVTSESMACLSASPISSGLSTWMPLHLNPLATVTKSGSSPRTSAEYLPFQ